MDKKIVEEKIDRELAVIADSREMLKGSLSKVSLGKRKRADGERTAWLLTWKGDDGKTKTVYVSENNLPRVRMMIANYKQARQALEKIARLCVEKIKNEK